jgi:hypothetical protein
MYRSLDSLDPFNLVKELKDIENSGVPQHKHEKEPHNFRRGRQNHQNERTYEASWKHIIGGGAHT